ncbi:hypothetical protein AGABI1DRAFT_43273 [Agaricus bisporus var. burnettii JB137-S8]|uniref:Uncharacterized protein n=1 Tax=Agaricus bisporus var. burnettii (strain JB137-S8 / ATCC MYA-4627 / FGSC 10392) TaxID=597362 RepID=K5X3P8_AGABU|nr:uncharacterized protein AGABI1DRAFT_43273 [Agaricus bisporus var. burnettii JB137-S8]EKM77547.1 hypothetical protein AGABI1DRAFT_43273 [Agaricus bisporus var. burnettii JB137-S8]
MVMRMKGSNGISPCRVCKITGVRGSHGHTHYIPLRRDQVQYAGPPRYDAAQLPLRVHDELMEQARTVQNAPNQATSDRLSKEYGIKGVPILSTISSISFPASFPFDFMHLIWENLIPNLILFWTSSFKALDHTGRGYVINTNDWKEIGARTADSKSTIPSAFGAPIPNIATQQGQMTSEMYSNWTLFVAPVLLCGRFQQPQYYTHFMRLVELLKMCLEYEIDAEMLDQIDVGFQSWVEDYESRLRCLYMSRIHYIQMVDKYAHQRNRAPEYVKRTFFGQLLRIIVLDLPPTPQLELDTRLTVIYAVVQAVKARVKKLSPESNGYYYQQTGAVEVVDLSTVKSVVGRVQDGNKWFIVDRSSISAPQVD